MREARLRFGHGIGVTALPRWFVAFHILAVQVDTAPGRMEVERDGGPGTALSHWDEILFDRELMTGYKDKGEHVLPITIDVMEAFGHQVVGRLERQTSLKVVLQGIASIVFSRQDEVRQIDLDHYEPTPLRETVPHGLTEGD